MDENMNYTNTHKSLYDDITLWEKTDGRNLFFIGKIGSRIRSQVKEYLYRIFRCLLLKSKNE